MIRFTAPALLAVLFFTVLFQGVTDGERSGKCYGQIPWRLGLLIPSR